MQARAISILLAGLCATVMPAEARVLAFRCSAPTGYQANYGELYALDGKPWMRKEDGIKWGADGFSNTEPMAIWNSDSPDELLISWGDAIPDEIARLLKRPLPEGNPWIPFKRDLEERAAFRNFRVVFRDENQIQALQERSCGVAGSCTKYIWTLFPKLELLTMARVGFLGNSFGKGGQAHDQVVVPFYSAKCNSTRRSS